VQFDHIRHVVGNIAGPATDSPAFPLLFDKRKPRSGSQTSMEPTCRKRCEALGRAGRHKKRGAEKRLCHGKGTAAIID
jgi:hypothetical protein